MSGTSFPEVIWLLDFLKFKHLKKVFPIELI